MCAELTITREEAAKRLRVSVSMVSRYIERGLLRAVWGGAHFDRVTAVRRDSVTQLAAWLEAKRAVDAKEKKAKAKKAKRQ